MKAVILAGGLSLKLYPLTRDIPKPLLPIANKPLLEYLIFHLKDNGIEDIIIALGDYSEKFINYFGHGEKYGVGIKYCIESSPIGTAGCLRDAKLHLDNSPFIVINGNVLTRVNIASMVSFHKESNAFATIGEIRDESSPIGIYMFNQEVFDFIPGRGYFDIKEQLLPLLKREQNSVHLFHLTGYWNNLFNISDYIHANYDILEDEIMNWKIDSSKLKLHMSPLGSIVVGDNCYIHKTVKLIGPLVIGDNCIIEEEVTIKNSIIWSDCHLKKETVLNHCIIAGGCRIPHNVNLSDTMLFKKNGDTFGSINIAMENHRRQPLYVVIGKCGSFSGILNTLYLKVSSLMKRVVDICISFIGLVLAMPIFALIGLAIKIDSKGPIFFIEKRMMHKNKEFKIIKFRSMVVGAEKMQEYLRYSNEVDGPMFKIENDPRLTRVGKFISQTSLDELPQLLNVLKGEMSLVGPRPLAEREIRYNPYWRDVRLMVKQGLTGAWQSEGKTPSFSAWIKHDVSYVKYQSFLLDIKILLKTVLLVIAEMRQSLKKRLINTWGKRDLARLFIVIMSPFFIFYPLSLACSQDYEYSAQVDEISEITQDKTINNNFCYIIGPGDVLDISVWRHPDLSKEVVVRPDGKIAFPIVKDIQAADLTPTELDVRLAEGLSIFIRNPEVTVTVRDFASSKIFVLGEVRRAGVYPFRGKMTVLEAISTAGSYTEDAVLQSIMLVRRRDTDKPEVMRINLEELIKKGNLIQNVILQPSDIVFVPRSFIAKVDTFIDRFFAKTHPALEYYLDLTDPTHR